MWFCRFEQLLHPFLYVFRHTPKTGMLNPVLGGVFSEGELLQAVFGDVFI